MMNRTEPTKTGNDLPETNKQLAELQAEITNLENRNKRLEMALDGTRAWYWDWWIETDDVTINRHWAAMIGYTIEELEPVTIKTWTSYCHPEDLAKSNLLLKSHFEGHCDYYEAEVRMKHKKGHWIWVLDRGKVYERDPDGNPLRMAGSHQDITAAKLAEEQLLRERNLFAGGPVMVFRWANSPGWPIEIASVNCGKITGFEASELSAHGILYANLIHPDDLSRIIAEITEFSADEERSSFDQEYRICKKDGSVICVYDYTIMIRNEKGDVTHFEGYILDITSRKATETALAYNREFERLISSLANQFINIPAGSIDSMINNALESIGKFVQADRSYIFQYYDNLRLMDNTHEWCAPGIEPQIDILKQLPTNIFAWSTAKIANNEIIIVPRVSELPDEACAEKDILQQQDILSLILIPLISGSIPFGYVGFDAVTQERQWSEENASVLKLAGGIIANALQRKQIELLIQHQLDLALKLSASSSIEETLDNCLHTALEISGMDCGGIYLFKDTDNCMQLAASAGLPESFLTAASSYPLDSEQCRLILKGKAVYSLMADIPANSVSIIRGEGLKAIAILPIVSRKKVIASLNVASHSLEAVPEFSRTALETVASQIGAAIVQAEHEELINTANRNLETLFNTIDDMLFIVDTNGTILHTNHTCREALGYTDQELCGMHVLKTHPPDRKDEAMRNIERMIAGKQTVCLVPLLTKSGELIPVETKINPGIWNGQPVLFGISRDINERIQSESALKESELRFRELTEFLPLSVLETDTNGLISYHNRKSLDLFGYSADEFDSGFSAFRLCLPEERPILEQTLGMILQEKSETIELTGLRKNGTVFPGMLYSSPVTKNGVVTGGRGIVVDLTSLKKAEEALRESAVQKRISQESKSIIDNIPGSVYRIEANGAIRFLSMAAEYKYLLKVAESPEPMRTAMTIIHPDDRDMVRETNRMLREHKASCVIIYRMFTEDGSIRWIEDRRSSIFTPEGDYRGIDGILIDVTERIAEDERKMLFEANLRKNQKLETIGTLAGGIAHDFNNILVPILGYAEMALTSLSAEDPVAEYIQGIMTAAERAKNLVSQILTFSRPEENNPGPVCLQAILKEALKLLRASIPSTISIQQHIDDTCRNVLADPSQMHQVIVNLCTNAFHALENSVGTITIELRDVTSDHPDYPESSLQGEDCIMLSVKDTGTGMSNATMERLFEPFFTTKPVNKGTGLGLPVVHGIIKSCKGAITVESHEGAGSTFRIFLPVIDKDVENIETANLIPQGSGSILFIDDEPATTKMIALMLSRLGYHTETCNSPVDALELFKKKTDFFDILITDLTMPEMTGIELAKKIHSINPSLPIMLMTGYGKDIDHSRPLDYYGIIKILKKPVKMQPLASAINELINQKP
ncbi:MAG: PAS domain S-box protein [Chlorobium sp.]|uniref:PAS domain S-box protein n=1 Tax=Chlorobium sp. TaxID=1095 RepID=UPI0025C6F644|nr:PAS domain S-box protein [Chlorobium sp.]MCF8215514.1 PAS domain S-box protein [Chlorobium sp.]MCF8270432.1 PAS domain S-box protein [Chlorobium sp.]MCF8286802.1 PAS domain S-box protein [Chlorobium sp.]MCF8290324.1 PAS domain S-box protein [Chlorobium sp.]MCF8384483.1 PAS domain S-box protein [Chlorobium sp.]